MNKHDVILDMKYDRLVYKSNRCCHPGATFNVKSKEAPLPATPIVKETPNYVILKKRKSSKLEPSSNAAIKETLDEAPVKDLAPEGPLDIAQVSAASFYRLNGRAWRRKGVRCFSLTIASIREELVRRITINDSNCVELKALIEITLEEVLKRLSIEYHDLKAAFDRAKANDLPPHRPYDHKI